MKVYNIYATQGNISFKQYIKADTYSEAKIKFANVLNECRKNHSFPYIQPDVKIDNIISRRY